MLPHRLFAVQRTRRKARGTPRPARRHSPLPCFEMFEGNSYNRHVRIARKPSAWCGTGPVIPCPRGSSPLGGCIIQISTSLPSSLDIHVGFAIFVWTGPVRFGIMRDTILETPLARAVFSFFDIDVRFATLTALTS